MPATLPHTPATLPHVRCFTVAEYHAMVRAGILKENDRIELIDGRLITMSPIGSRHAACVDRLTRLFILSVGDDAVVRVQSPIRLDNRSEPEPDVALLAPKDLYAARHPRPDEVLLVVEVAVTTLPFDRDVKLPLYARAGIPEVWIVALDEDQVYVCRQPSPEGYATCTTLTRSDTVHVEALADAGPFAVADLLNA